MASSAKTPTGKRTAKPVNGKSKAAVAKAKPASRKVKPAMTPAMKAVVPKLPLKKPLKANAGPVSRAIEKKVVEPTSARPEVDKVMPTTEKAKEKVKEKGKKAKLIRDSFTIPEAEYEVLAQVKRACIQAGFEIKKSELLRVGVALIREMQPARLEEILRGLPRLKSGRPKKL